MSRRSETTDEIKEEIADAFIELMKKEDPEKISVSEIVKKANVGRVTYYRQFDHKDEMLVFKFKMIKKRWDQTHPDTEESGVEFFYEYKDFFTLLEKYKKLPIIYDAIYEIFEEERGVKEGENYLLSFVIYGFIGIITEWIHQGFKDSPEKINMFFKMVQNNK